MALLERIEAGTGEAPRRPRESLVSYPPSSELAFPGCKPVRLPREELELYDGRLEFWDGATETAWVCRAQQPLPREAGGRVAESGGSASPRCAARPSPATARWDLMVRNEGGLPWRILQADQSVYLHPGRARLPGAVAMEVGDARLAGRGAGGGPHHGRVPGEAAAVRGVGVPGGVGGGARTIGRRADRSAGAPGADDSRAGGGRVPGVAGEPGISGLGVRRSCTWRSTSGCVRRRTCEVLERVGSALGARRGRDRTTIRCCVPCAARAGRKAGWKAVPGWCARCCRRGASDFRRTSRRRARIRRIARGRHRRGGVRLRQASRISALVSATIDSP